MTDIRDPVLVLCTTLTRVAGTVIGVLRAALLSYFCLVWGQFTVVRCPGSRLIVVTA